MSEIEVDNQDSIVGIEPNNNQTARRALTKMLREGVIPSKACWTLLFKVWVRWADTEEGPPVDGGFDVRLI
jgi:hypothetical protein